MTTARMPLDRVACQTPVADFAQDDALTGAAAASKDVEPPSLDARLV